MYLNDRQDLVIAQVVRLEGVLVTRVCSHPICFKSLYTFEATRTLHIKLFYLWQITFALKCGNVL